MRPECAEDWVKWRMRDHAEYSLAWLPRDTASMMVDHLEWGGIVNRRWVYLHGNKLFDYAKAGAEAAISRMLDRGQLIECKKGVVRRPNPGPSRECCYRIFSDVCLMDGPTYKEIGGDSWPYTEYHVDQVVSATHELERRGLIQGCFGYYTKHGGGAKHWYPTGKSFPVSWLSMDRDGVLAYERCYSVVQRGQRLNRYGSAHDRERRQAG